jgi:mRNA interferase MazF
MSSIENRNRGQAPLIYKKCVIIKAGITPDLDLKSFFVSLGFRDNMENMKDYKNWHSIKSEIEKTGQEKKFSEREIWWCSLGENIGFEQDGKHEKFERPVLVLRKFNNGMFFGLPLTSREKKDKFHFGFFIKTQNKNGEWEEQPSFAILSQMRLLSSKRMIRRVVKINENLFSEIEKSFIRLVVEKPQQKPNGPLSGSSGA